MMAVQDQLPDPIFIPELHSNTPGSINFGYVDDKIYTGNLVKMPVDNQTQSSWLVDGVVFGSGGSNLSSKALPLLFGKCTPFALPTQPRHKIRDSTRVDETKKEKLANAYHQTRVAKKLASAKPLPPPPTGPRSKALCRTPTATGFTLLPHTLSCPIF